MVGIPSKGRHFTTGACLYYLKTPLCARWLLAVKTMKVLRNLSARPTLLREAAFVLDPSGDFVGREGPFGRNRVIFALPMAPVEIRPRLVVHDGDGAYLSDPDGTLIGMDRIIVHRMLSARWTEDTRRLSGG